MSPTEDATPTQAATGPRHWAKFTDDQRAAAAELARRAERLRANSEDGISVTEAVALAAIQMGLES